ncbi:MAG: hypothetical protein DBY41_05705 [Clostridium sp.]|nr:MAG: hypothetical protein DBY41_05705 [Clostridium sp.]
MRKVPGVEGPAENREGVHQKRDLPGQGEPGRLRKGRLDGPQGTAEQKKKMNRKSPPAITPEGFGDGTSIKFAGCCQTLAAGGSLYQSI